jgi:hypothetical protein
MMIIQVLFQFYLNQNKDSNPWKQTFWKWHTQEKLHNINGTTLHSRLLIPLNKSINDLKPINDERHDALAT